VSSSWLMCAPSSVAGCAAPLGLELELGLLPELVREVIVPPHTCFG
jgi:hypothetical protein